MAGGYLLSAVRMLLYSDRFVFRGNYLCKAEFKYEGMSNLAFSRFLYHLKGVFKSFSIVFRT